MEGTAPVAAVGVNNYDCRMPHRLIYGMPLCHRQLYLENTYYNVNLSLQFFRVCFAEKEEVKSMFLNSYSSINNLL